MLVLDQILATGVVPDKIIRWYVRRLCRKRIIQDTLSDQERDKYMDSFINDISQQSVALLPDTANLQHYEVSTQFYRTVLGPRMKYSCCYFENYSQDISLKDAEIGMLDLTCKRAQIIDGMKILELGCGWGSLTLYMAERYPKSQITAVTNSSTQKQYIEGISKKLGLYNIEVVKADMNHFSSDSKFDRVVSIEMFEHMRNWPSLLSRISGWLLNNGKLFLHFFTFTGLPYLYDGKDRQDWMARNFFDGGMMPSVDLINHFNESFDLEQQWNVNGIHYQMTLEAWLKRMDESKNVLFPLFEKEYNNQANKYWNNWRVFFMSCAEVFGFNQGNSWSIQHNLLSKKVS